MIHILASLMFGLIALAALAMIAFMLAESRTAISAALGLSQAVRSRRYRAPVRVKVRRMPTWAPSLELPRTTAPRRVA